MHVIPAYSGYLISCSHGEKLAALWLAARATGMPGNVYENILFAYYYSCSTVELYKSIENYIVFKLRIQCEY